MPEGPEIRQVADRIEKAISGKPLKHVYFKFEHLKKFEPAFKGASLLFVQTVGKGFLLHFDCGLSFYGHNQLYGKWFITPQIPEDSLVGKRELRASFETNISGAFLYSASEMQVVPTENVLEIPFIQRNNGLDILGTSYSTSDIFEYISQKKFSQKSLSSLLLDQKFILGMGNYLRSEVLFCAGISPEAKLIDLDNQERKNLSFWINEIMRRSYLKNGVTNDLKREQRLKSEGVDFESRRFFVFDREGKSCYECRSVIKRIEKSGRRLYFCPGCQKA